MASVLSDKKSKVIIVDPSGPVRLMMSDTVRAVLGFETVDGKASVQDVISFLEVEPVSWVIVPLFADQAINGLHLAKLCTEHPELKGVRISLCLEESEHYVLPTAYELGVLNHFRRPMTKDTLTEELKTLAGLMELHQHSEPLVAAHYLRTALKAAKNDALQLDLEKKLLDVFPGNTQVMLELASPLVALGQKEAARKSLLQVKILEPKLADKADSLARTLIPDGGPLGNKLEEGGETGINIIGANNIIIIDSDDATAHGVEETLKRLGAQSVQRFANGEDAWAALEKNPEPELIITEWRIPKLSGPMLIQRIRHHGFLNVPIIVQSSLLKTEDMPFVREIGVANIVTKPFNREQFIPAVLATMQQERLPTENVVLERKILALLKAQKIADAEPLKVKFLGDPRVTLARKRLIEGEFAFASGHFMSARDAGLEALKQAGDNILVLNLLGKTFMRLSAFDSAVKCFKKAQDMSPQNLERLCIMAEAQSEMGDDAAASATLQGAKKLDGNSQQVSEAETKIAINKGDTVTAKKLMAGFDSIDHVVAYMNNKAVALARTGARSEAISVYKKTLESVPDDKIDQKAIVLYNLALAQIRDSEYDAALAKLKDAAKLKSAKMGKKILSLQDRLRHARDTGGDFQLKSSEVDTSAKNGSDLAAGNHHAKDTAAGKDSGQDSAKLATEEEHRRVAAMVEVKRGELCCFLLFTQTGVSDPRVTALLAKAPRFQSRQAIARDEAMGAERMLKSG